MRVERFVGVCFVLLAGCAQKEAALVNRLTAAADLFESNIDKFERPTVAGQPCYELIDGYIHYRKQDAGHRIASEVQMYEHEFNFTVVILDAYKTSLHDRFDAQAKRFDAWKSGPYVRAIEACKACAGEGLGQSCTVP